MELKMGKYKHFKGHEYAILCVGRDSETFEEVVVYQGLYDSEEFGAKPIWVRPKKEFLETVTVDGKEIPRFEYLGEG